MIKLLGGDFGAGKYAIIRTTSGTKKFKELVIAPGFISSGPTIHRKDIDRIEVVNAGSGVDTEGVIGGGLMGAILAGPLGMLAGAVIGGHGSQILLMVYLKDGRQFLGVANQEDYGSLLPAVTLDKHSLTPITPPPACQNENHLTAVLPASGTTTAGKEQESQRVREQEAERARKQEAERARELERRKEEWLNRKDEARRQATIMWRSVLAESKAIFTATAEQSRRLVHYAKAWWAIYRARKVLDGLRFRLGRKIYQSGAGDRALVEQIAALTHQIESPNQRMIRSWSLKRERWHSTLRLADLWLTQDPLPNGVGAEYWDFETGNAAECAAAAQLATARTSLSPSNNVEWRRVGIGFGAIAFTILVVLLFVLPGQRQFRDSTSPTGTVPTDSNRPSRVRQHLHTNDTGAVATITLQDQEILTAATEEAANTGVVDSDLAEMLRSGRIFYVPNGTEVEVMRSVGLYSEVQILEGASKGRDVWVLSEVVGR